MLRLQLRCCCGCYNGIKILERLHSPRKETLQELDESRMNPVTSPENPTTPATPTTPASPYNTNQPAISSNIRLAQLASITQQSIADHIAHHAIIQQPIADHTITQQTIAEQTKAQRLHRKLQYLTQVLKSRRDILFSHKMI